jgi:L-alanine-DL-glutamate epimerase-like enolase superfamily enzyme
MKLTFWRCDLSLAFPWTVAGGPTLAGKTVAEQVFIKLTAEDSAFGLGEAAPPIRYGESAQSVLDYLARVDAQRLAFDNLESSRRYLESLAPGHQSAKAALEVALLDGAARKANCAIYDYLGLGFTEGRHVTSYSIGIDQPEVVRRKAKAAAEYPILKLKLGGAQDRASLAALREAAPGKTIRVDANEAWANREQALKNIEWLAADGRVQFVEQPMPAASDPRDLAWLRQHSPLPLFADESFHRAADAPRCAELFHGVNVKLAKTGGLLEAYQALQSARRAGLKTMIGCMIESSLLISAAAHLAEMADFLDLDGNLLITNDPYAGITSANGILSFATARERTGLRVWPRAQNEKGK